MPNNNWSNLRKTMKTGKYYLILLSVLFSISAKTENTVRKWSERYNITHITTDNGMPHNFVDDLFKDSKGFLWVATRGEGVARYDGYEFIPFNRSTPKAKLRSNFIHSMTEDNFQRLWIAGEMGINLLDIQTLETLDLSPTGQLLCQIQNHPVNHIYHSRNGNIWACSQNKLFKIILSSDGSISQIITVCENKNGQNIRTVCEVDDYIWFNYNDGIFRVKENITTPQEPILVSQQLQFQETYFSVIRKRSNEVWMGSSRGLLRYNMDTESIKYYTYMEDNDNSLSQNMITDIAVTDNHTVIVATLKGVNLYNEITDSFERISRNFSGINEQNALNCDFVNCLLTDGDIIWVGTEIGGINKISKRTLYVQNYSHSSDLPGSISHNPVNAIFEDNYGTLWVGTVEGGLNRKGPNEHAFTHYSTQPPTRLTHNSVSCFTADNQNRLWVGTWGGGFGWIHLKDNNKIFHHIQSPDFSDASWGFIGAICYDSLNHAIWAGSSENLYMYDIKNNQLSIPFQADGLGGIDGCTGYLNENGDYLWIGMTKGLCRIDLHTVSKGKPSYQLWEYKLDEPESQLPERVTDIILSHNGTIWIGSNGYGFYRSMMGKDGNYTFKGYTVNDGLASNSVRGLEEDDEGRIWITTTNGLSCFEPENETFYNYTREDGLLSNQFYWNATGKSANGDIYLGSINGLTVIKPSVRDLKTMYTPIVFTHLKVGEQEIKPTSNTIRMHERDKSLSFEFAALDYYSSSLTAYSYRLRGFDDKWKKVSANQRIATYTNLRSGDYAFELRYAPDGTQWLGNTAVLHIHIEPYFYKTYWFIALIILLLFFIIYWYMTWRIHSFRQQQILLQEKVKERTHELQEQKQVLITQADELYSQNELLKQQNLKISNQKEQLVEMSNKIQELTVDKLAFFTNITHEFRTPLTLIVGPIERALKLSYNPQVIEQLHFVEKNSKYLLSLINQLMDFRKIESGKMKIVPNPNNFNQFLSDILLPFEAYANEHQITLRRLLKISSHPVMYDESAMQKVLTNLLGNAIKFTPKGGKISIYANYLSRNGKDLLYLCIQDNGPGIPESEQEKIFTRFYQVNNQSNTPISGQSGTGIGLYLCQQIIQLHQGEIHYHDNPSGGSSFRILLPLIYASVKDKEGEITEPKDLDEQPPSTHPLDNSRLNILVVEDNVDMRSYIRSILEEYYNVTEATQGKEALDILATQNIDFIISDLMMPVMDGMELSKRIKANFNLSHIPFLMLTAKTSNETRIESFRIGVDEYLLKPFDETLLLARIANILENRKHYQQKFSINMDIEELNIDEESSDMKFLNKAMQIIKENYKDSYYEVTDFIEAMGVSKSLMNKKMKNLTGQSAGQFIRNYRLNIARELILKNKITRNKNISEIAYEVGFNDPKYFTRCFTRHFNQPPSSLMEVRKEDEDSNRNSDEMGDF